MTRLHSAVVVLVVALSVTLAPLGVAGITDASPTPPSSDGTSPTRPAVERGAGVGTPTAVTVTETSVSISETVTANGSYSYEVPDSSVAENLSIELTGRRATENETVSGTFYQSGASASVSVGGNLPPTAADGFEPQLTVTGHRARQANTHFCDTCEATNVSAFGGADTEFEVRPEPGIESMTITELVLPIEHSGGTGAVVDVFVVEERPDLDYTDGTLVKDKWQPPARSGNLVVDIQDITVTSFPITVAFVTRNATASGEVFTLSATVEEGAETSSTGGNLTDAQAKLFIRGTGPQSLTINASSGASHSFGSLGDRESKTAPLNLTTGTQALTASYEGGGSLSWSLEYTERTDAVNPAVSVNGYRVSTSGRLDPGERRSLTADADWIRTGTNTITVETSDGSLSDDAPDPVVGLNYSHALVARETPTPTPTPTPEADDGSDERDEDDDEDDSDSSDGGGGGGGGGAGGGGGGGGGGFVAESTPTPTATPTPTVVSTATTTPTPEAVAGQLPDGVSPNADDTVVTDVSFERPEVVAGEQAVLSVTVANPQPTADTHTIRVQLFDQIVNVREVTVPGRQAVTVRFTHRIVAPGTYTATVGSESATIRVRAPTETAASSGQTSTQFPGFEPVTALLAVVLAAVLARRRL